jgi:hypothetical protein
MDDNLEFIINNQLSRLKEEEKTLKNALFLKTRKYVFNNNDNLIIKWNPLLTQTTTTTTKSSIKLENIKNNLKYFDDLNTNMHNCHLCSSHNDLPKAMVINSFGP